VDEELRQRMGEAALNVVRAAGYVNAGTVEFLMDDERNFYFLEMNTRLQVEHPVTEVVTGIDIVREQFRIAAGEPLAIGQQDVRLRGWAIECRIYAEDPERNFLPSPGVIRNLVEPQGPGVRVDSGVYCGWEVPIHYDPLIAKLVTHGSDRSQAIARMKRALGEYEIQGIRTNLGFFAGVLSDPEFEAGRLSTGFIEEFLSRRAAAPQLSHGDSEAYAAAAALTFAEDSPPHEPGEEKAMSAWRLSARRGAANVRGKTKCPTGLG
jgi:acetyl-CoA carboxylase biotin carboxylase subunit